MYADIFLRVLIFIYLTREIERQYEHNCGGGRQEKVNELQDEADADTPYFDAHVRVCRLAVKVGRTVIFNA